MEKRVISKLAEIDPTFVQVVRTLYGPTADPRELWDLRKSMPTQSDVHANSARERRLAATGMGATGVATVGGIHALKMSAEKFKKPSTAKHRAPKVKLSEAKAFKRLPPKVKAAGVAAVPVGWLALHSTELAGDALGVRAQTRAYKANKPKKGKVVKVDSSPYAAFKKPLIPKLPEHVDLPGMKAKKVKPPTAVKKGLRTVNALGGYFRQAHAAENIKAARKGRKMLLAGGVATTATGGAVGYQKLKARKVPQQAKFTVPVKGGQVGVKAGVKKNYDNVDFEFSGLISKVDTDKRLVFGWCSLSKVNGEQVVDLQGDYIPIEETEKSAYNYVLHSRKGGDMHKRVSKSDDQALHTSNLVESFVVTPEKLQRMGLPPDALPLGWWTGFKVHDDQQWADVKAGKRLGFSLHGRGRRVEM